MNISLFKLISILSCFLGAVGGFLALLPYIDGFVFIILMCFASVIVMTFLIKTNILRLETVNESFAIGGIIGFLSYLAFSIIYIPLVIISIRVFNYAANYSIAIFAGHANLFIIIMLTVFVALVSAIINAGSGFAVYYFTELFKNINNR